MKTPVIVGILGVLASAHPLVKSSLNGLMENMDPKSLEGKPDHHRHHSSSSSSDDVRLALDGGWYSFQFGKEGTYVDTEFCFYLHGPAILKVTDYYCSGDRFGVKDNGVWLGPTSYVPFDHCHTNTTNPTHAYHSPAFSHAAFHLAPGSHRITLKVLISPYNGGSAAIRLDSVFHKCPTLKHGLALVNTHVPFCEAAKVCHSYDMDLANLDIFNFLDATDVAFQCAGAFSQSWINSWSENSYGHSCLALSTGVSAPGGAINIPDSCNKKLPVLCQARKSPCGWDKPCHHDRHHHDDHCSKPESSSDSSCSSRDRHHHHRKQPCNRCQGDDWGCWNSCGDNWSYEELECQPHMPCWPQWCLKHNKCNLAIDTISKFRKIDDELKKAQLVDLAKKQQAEAKAAQEKKIATEKAQKEQAAAQAKKQQQAKPQVPQKNESGAVAAGAPKKP